MATSSTVSNHNACRTKIARVRDANALYLASDGYCIYSYIHRQSIRGGNDPLGGLKLHPISRNLNQQLRGNLYRRTIEGQIAIHVHVHVCQS